MAFSGGMACMCAVHWNCFFGLLVDAVVLGAGHFSVCQVVGSLIVFVDVFDFFGVLMLVKD